MTSYKCDTCGITGRATSQAVIDDLHANVTEDCPGHMVRVKSPRRAAPSTEADRG